MFEIVAGIGIFLGYIYVSHVLDYKILKEKYMKEKKWDLNISCGNTCIGKINADVVKRDVPNFVLVKDIYNMPFKDKEFNEIITSHTIEHVDNPDLFYKELSRISKNVTILLPPIWDFASMFWILEHKWLFLTLHTKHVNNLPSKIKMPYDLVHKIIGQRIK